MLRDKSIKERLGIELMNAKCDGDPTRRRGEGGGEETSRGWHGLQLEEGERE